MSNPIPRCGCRGLSSEQVFVPSAHPRWSRTSTLSTLDGECGTLVLRNDIDHAVAAALVLAVFERQNPSNLAVPLVVRQTRDSGLRRVGEGGVEVGRAGIHWCSRAERAGHDRPCGDQHGPGPIRPRAVDFVVVVLMTFSLVLVATMCRVHRLRATSHTDSHKFSENFSGTKVDELAPRARGKCTAPRELCQPAGCRIVGSVIRPGYQAKSNRSRFMTLTHAATKSFTNFSFASSVA
jgi:hypothetical protein